MSYYLAVTGWTLGFAVESYTGNITSFAEFTEGYSSLVYFFAVALITSFVVAKGVKAIELLSKIMMPFLVLIVIFLAGYGLSLDKAGEALFFLFRPEWNSLLNFKIWLLAFGQAFYSLAVGQGYLITYGSFLPDKVNLPRAAGVVALGETLIALLAGIIIFPVVFSFGINPEQGTQLAFTTLPIIFDSIPFGGVLAVFFFTLFFLAAISSCIAGMEVVKTAFREEFGLSHRGGTFFAFIPVLPLGFLSALSFTPIGFTFLGRPFLEVLDLFAANQVVVASGIVGGALISWSFSKKDLIKNLDIRQGKIVELFVFLVRSLPVLATFLLILSWII
jgi:NSS family neurotransmitter:Na+ symporter